MPKSERRSIAVKAEIHKTVKKKKKKTGDRPPRAIADLKEHEKLRLRPLPMHLESLVISFADAARKDARKAEADIGKVIVLALTDKIAATETTKETAPLPYCRVCDVVFDYFAAFYDHINSVEHADRKANDSVPLFAEVGPDEQLTTSQVVAREFMGAALLDMDDDDLSLDGESTADEESEVEGKKDERELPLKEENGKLVVDRVALNVEILKTYSDIMRGIKKNADPAKLRTMDKEIQRLMAWCLAECELPPPGDCLQAGVYLIITAAFLGYDEMTKGKTEVEVCEKMRKHTEEMVDIRRKRLKEDEEKKMREGKEEEEGKPIENAQPSVVVSSSSSTSFQEAEAKASIIRAIRSMSEEVGVAEGAEPEGAEPEGAEHEEQEEEEEEDEVAAMDKLRRERVALEGRVEQLQREVAEERELTRATREEIDKYKQEWRAKRRAAKALELEIRDELTALLSSLTPTDIVGYRLKRRPCAECANLWAEYGFLLAAHRDVSIEFAFRSHPRHPCVALLNLVFERFRIESDSDEAVRASKARPVKFPSKEQLKELGVELEKQIDVPLTLGGHYAYSCTENFQVAMHDRADKVRAVYEKFMEQCRQRDTEGRAFFCDICRVVMPSGRHFRLHLLSEQHNKKTGIAPARQSSLYNPLCQMVSFIDVPLLLLRRTQQQKKEERKAEKREKEEAEKSKADEDKKKEEEEEEEEQTVAGEGSRPLNWFENPAFAVANPARRHPTKTKVLKKIECVRTTVDGNCSFIPLVEVTPDDVPPGIEKIVDKHFVIPK